MIVNFVGSTTTGYVGEVSDETHIVREMRELGHTVNFVPRDVWKAYVDGYTPNADWILPTKSDINIICKWPHFNDEKYISKLKDISGSPVFYWSWDWMDWNKERSIDDWHMKMCKASDVHLTNEGAMLTDISYFGIRAYYFPFDCSDRFFDKVKADKKYDVVFFGSHVGKGNRLEYLRSIKDYIHPVIFSWNYESWAKEGFEAYPAVYGNEFAKKVAESRIILGFSVEPNCWGYWSNRVGKVLTTGGFLLYEYAPGMELAIRGGAEYFNSIEELKEKIDHYLIADDEREKIADIGYNVGRKCFTSQNRVQELMVLIDRYLRGALIL